MAARFAGGAIAFHCLAARSGKKIATKSRSTLGSFFFFIGAIAGVSKVILLDKVGQLAVRLV
jgi:hypothetical protein